VTSTEFLEAGHHTVEHRFAGQAGTVHEWDLTKLSPGELCLHCEHCESEVFRTSERSWIVRHEPECPWLRADPPFGSDR
jgi:hypothetical protein